MTEDTEAKKAIREKFLRQHKRRKRLKENKTLKIVNTEKPKEAKK